MINKFHILASYIKNSYDSITNGDYDYFDMTIRKSNRSKNYPNKNANIRYYTDEKGNIRKVKKVVKNND